MMEYTSGGMLPVVSGKKVARIRESVQLFCRSVRSKTSTTKKSAPIVWSVLPHQACVQAIIEANSFLHMDLSEEEGEVHQDGSCNCDFEAQRVVFLWPFDKVSLALDHNYKECHSRFLDSPLFG